MGLLILIPLIVYPLLAIIFLLLKKPIEFMLSKIIESDLNIKRITIYILAIATFPIHVHSKGYLAFDLTMPLYFYVKEWWDGIGPGGLVNFITPFNFTKTGLDFWLFGSLGVFFQILWLYVVLLYLRRPVK